MNEVQNPLLPGKGAKTKGQFSKQFNQCQIQLKSIKQKNDSLQKISNNDLDKNILRQIKRQGDFVEDQTKELHTRLQTLKGQFRDPQSQNKVKNMLNELSKQIQRNKNIMKNYISRVSAISAPRNNYSSSILDDQDIKRQNKRQSRDFQIDRQDSENYGENRKINLSSLKGQQQQVIQVDLAIQREKKKMLDELQVRMNRVNELVNDIAIEVDEQGNALDIIGENTTNAYNRVQDANEQLEKAQGYQKKSKKKYLICLMLVIILAIAVGGVAYLLL